MWMMGYNDGGDPFTGRKLRTIVPRPAAVINPTCLGRIHGTDLLSFNHHLAAMTEQNKRDFSPQQVVVSSRWNPTPEQLQTLEELYRRGTRTPSAEEIQHITAQLRRYGKIEGKNVFYWFQNHKARERQKRRRQLESTSSITNSEHEPSSAAASAAVPHHSNNGTVENDAERKEEEEEEEEEESGANGTGLEEVEGTKNWPSSTNCSILAEKTGGASIRRTAIIQECRVADGRWVHFDEEAAAAAAEFQQRKSLEDDLETNATWHMMMQFSNNPSSSSSPSPLSSPTTCNHHRHHSSSTAAPIYKYSPAIRALTTSIPLDPKQLLIKNTTSHPPPSPSIFLNPYRSGYNNFHHQQQQHLINIPTIHDHRKTNCCGGGGGDSDQTLQLFPLRNSDEDDDDGNEDVADEKESEGSEEAMNNGNTMSTTPYKFFEFLPLKN